MPIVNGQNMLKAVASMNLTCDFSLTGTSSSAINCFPRKARRRRDDCAAFDNTVKNRMYTPNALRAIMRIARLSMSSSIALLNHSRFRFSGNWWWERECRLNFDTCEVHFVLMFLVPFHAAVAIKQDDNQHHNKEKGGRIYRMALQSHNRPVERIENPSHHRG